MSKMESIQADRERARELSRQGIQISRGALENFRSIRDILGEVPTGVDDELQSQTTLQENTARTKAGEVAVGEGGARMRESSDVAGQAAEDSRLEAQKAESSKGVFSRIMQMCFGKNEAADGASKAARRAGEYRETADGIKEESDLGLAEYEELIREFDGLPADSMGFIGTTREAHAAFLNENTECDYEAYDTPQVETISPARIEGVNVGGDREMNNPEIFWNHHSNSRERYMEMASHIPEVQGRLAAGETLEQIRSGGSESLKACATYYFGSEMVKVTRADGYYSFNGDGRHRVLAARELGYEIPVRVTGVFRKK